MPLIVWIPSGRPLLIQLIVVDTFVTTQCKLLITSNEVFIPESELSFGDGAEQTNLDGISSTACHSVL
jgi:hypothetical protein